MPPWARREKPQTMESDPQRLQMIYGWKYKINTFHVFREVIEPVENMNMEEQTLPKEQADLKENKVKLPEVKNIIIGVLKLLERKP